MLLVLKTNDLIRGIEHTLQTSSRMGAFRVMSQCCINSIYNERKNKETSRFGRFKMTVVQFWALFKIRVYYTILGIKQLIGE